MAECDDREQQIPEEPLEQEDLNNLLKTITARQQILLDSLVICDDVLMLLSQLKADLAENVRAHGVHEAEQDPETNPTM